jgi:hypothetical protein
MSFPRRNQNITNISTDLIDTIMRDTNLDIDSFAVAAFIAVNSRKLITIEDIALL